MEQFKRFKEGEASINININLKVEAKSNTVGGKKVKNQKQIVKNASETIRPNVTNESLKRKKQHMDTISSKYKRSVIEYSDQDEGYDFLEEKTTPTKRVQNKFDQGKQVAKNKRLKSKSLQNLKLKERLEKSIQKHLRSIDKSNKSNKSKSQSKERSNKNKKYYKQSPERDNNQKSKSKEKSKSKIKSRDTSPLLLHKKKSVTVFKIKEELKIKKKQKTKQTQQIGSKSSIKISSKKSMQAVSNLLNREENGKVNIEKSSKVISKKKSIQPKRQIKRQGEMKKKQIKYVQNNLVKRKKSSKSKKIKEVEFEADYLEKMAIRIQSLWRGYSTRKQFREELNQITKKIQQIRKSLNEKQLLWKDSDSDSNSIINIARQTNQQFHFSKDRRLQIEIHQKTQDQDQKNAFIKKLKPNIKQSNHFNLIEIPQKSFNSSNSSDQFIKLKKQLEETRVKNQMLEQENVHLKKISVLKNKQQDNIQDLDQETFKNTKKSNILRLDSQESKHLEQTHQKNIKNISQIKSLIPVIKTEESYSDNSQLSEYKKRAINLQCSPKNFTHKFELDQDILIKKLVLKKQEEITKRYLKKSQQYKQLAQNKLFSPKTYHFKCEELQKYFKREKQQSFQKIQEIGKVLDFIKQQLNENNEEVSQECKKEEQNWRNKQNNYEINKLELNIDQQSLNFEKKITQEKQKQRLKLMTNTIITIKNNDDEVPKFEALDRNNKCIEISLDKSVIKRQSYENLEEKQFQDENSQHTHQDGILQVKNNMFEHTIDEIKKKQPSRSEKQSPKSQQGLQKMKGFDTGLQYIREYYIQLCEFFRKNESFERQILINLSSEMELDPLAFLKSYRTYMILENEQVEEDKLIYPYFKLVSDLPCAIPLYIFNSFQNELLNEESPNWNEKVIRLKDLQMLQSKALGYSVYELKQYHDMSLFDAFNEALNEERPGGKEGSNLQFITKQYLSIAKHKNDSLFDLKTPLDQRQNQIDVILGSSIAQVLNVWASSLCGFINDDSEEIDPNKITEIRQNRLALMLEKLLLDEEKQMTNMYLFRLDVIFNKSQAIFNLLLEQFINQLVDIIRGKSFLFQTLTKSH